MFLLDKGCTLNPKEYEDDPVGTVAKAQLRRAVGELSRLGSWRTRNAGCNVVSEFCISRKTWEAIVREGGNNAT